MHWEWWFPPERREKPCRVSRGSVLSYIFTVNTSAFGGYLQLKVLNKKTSRPPSEGLWTPCVLTSLASMTVPTPTVRAMVGTLARSPSKNRALARMVSMASVFTRVLDTRLEPGSLKAMCPSGPMPAQERRSGQPCQCQGPTAARVGTPPPPGSAELPENPVSSPSPLGRCTEHMVFPSTPSCPLGTCYHPPKAKRGALRIASASPDHPSATSLSLLPTARGPATWTESQ